MKSSLWALSTLQAADPAWLDPAWLDPAELKACPFLRKNSAGEQCSGNVSCPYLALPVRCIDKDDVFWQLVIRNQDVIQLIIHCFPGDLQIQTQRRNSKRCQL